ncbi:MAG TPA: LytTR family DNA-binding domain-containing protein, partial [Bacteroidales bacterium]|nr:LytTR family DNA-binding domain-containing protein [Bacteroidales bacterium]
GEAGSIADGRALLAKTQVELVFLDVQMPDGTGFDLLAGLEKISFQVIFASAYDHFAITAFKFSAVDYLLKPIIIEDLKAAVKKIRLSDKSSIDRIKTLIDNQGAIKKIALPSMEEVNFVKVEDIIRYESDNNYTRFFLTGNQQILVSKTLKEYEDLLEPLGFFRSHKSSLINLRYIKKYIKGEGGTIVMEDGSIVELSRRRKDDFFRVLQNNN